MMSSFKHFLWIAASVADCGGVNLDGIKTLLANGFSTFFIKGKPVFSHGPRSLPKNPPDCPILCKWDFDYFKLADSFVEALRSFKTCVLANNNLCGKFFSSLESQTTKLHQNLGVTSVPFFLILIY